jgi:hypothetical protein
VTIRPWDSTDVPPANLTPDAVAVLLRARGAIDKLCRGARAAGSDAGGMFFGLIISLSIFDTLDRQYRKQCDRPLPPLLSKRVLLYDFVVHELQKITAGCS